MINTTINKINENKTLAVGIMALFAILSLVIPSNGFNLFNISRITGIGMSAVVAGLTVAVAAYNANKGIKTALAIAFGGVVGAVIFWVIGDAVVSLIIHNRAYLATW